MDSQCEKKFTLLGTEAKIEDAFLQNLLPMKKFKNPH